MATRTAAKPRSTASYRGWSARSSFVGAAMSGAGSSLGLGVNLSSSNNDGRNNDTAMVNNRPRYRRFDAEGRMGAFNSSRGVCHN